jgi:iron complex transport system substrate-binding protein
MTRSFVAVVSLFVATIANAQVSMRDDLGRLLQVKGAATRIVTLAPFLTELVYAAGAGGRVVGASDLSEYPPQVKPLATVGTGAKFSMEQIATLKPDLVFAWRDGIRREDVDQMTAFGATVYVAQARQLNDVPRLLRAIGLLTGSDVTQVVDGYEQKLEGLRRSNAMKPKVSAFLEVWNRPLTTVSGTHFMNEALEICRAENVFKDLEGVLPRVSWDEVQERNPYMIVGAGSASNTAEFRANWQLRQMLPAVKADRLVYVGADGLQRPTVRTADGVAELCEMVDQVRGTVDAKTPQLRATPQLQRPPAPPPAPAQPRVPDTPPERPSQYGL